MPAKLAGHDETLRARVRLVPDATLVEMVEWTRTTLDVTVSVRTMWKRLKMLGLTLKKSRSSPANGRGQMSPRLAATGTN